MLDNTVGAWLPPPYGASKKMVQTCKFQFFPKAGFLF